MPFGQIFLGHSGQSRTVTEQDSVHLARSRRWPYNKRIYQNQLLPNNRRCKILLLSPMIVFIDFSRTMFWLGGWRKIYVFVLFWTSNQAQHSSNATVVLRQSVKASLRCGQNFIQKNVPGKSDESKKAMVDEKIEQVSIVKALYT